MSQDDFDAVVISASSDADTFDPYYGAVPHVYHSTVSIDPNRFTQPTWTTTGTSGSWNISDVDLTSPPSGKIRLEGEDADIEINGRSLTQILDSIEQRLGMLKCREDLEKDWHELKRLGDQYRALVKDIEEKHKIWDALKR